MKGIISIIIFILLSAAVNAQTTRDTLAKKDTLSHSSKVGFAISGNFGGGIASANAGNPDMSRLNYSNVSNQGLPNATYSSSGGLNIGFDLDLIFGKQRNIELSAGLTYIYTKGTADFSGYHAEYEAQDGNGNNFRRLLNATQASESLSYGNVSIPVLFKYSTNPDKKMGAYIQLGPVLSISSSASGTMNSTTDFEAVYHYDATTKGFVYSPATQPSDWVLTKQAISSELPAGQSVNNYFSQLYSRGYYVGLGESANGKVNKVTYHIGGGMMTRLGGEYRASKMIHVLFGITALLISNGRSVSSYAPITASNDLTTISQSNFLNGTSSLLTMQVGVNLGVQVRLIK
jgi:hypothetical protein